MPLSARPARCVIPSLSSTLRDEIGQWGTRMAVSGASERIDVIVMTEELALPA